ncbi:hypothetical protein ACTGJ9_023755 [Bradyrhizobium sp. RDM12]
MAKADADVTSEHRLFPPFTLFVCLVAMREEIGARKGTVTPSERDCRAAYNAALVDAIAAEDDTGDDCCELEAMHAAQRRARRGGR